VTVEPGAHVVELRYEPKAFARGRFVSFAGLCALVLGIVVMLRRRSVDLAAVRMQG
jgi:hypothetical protein